MEADVTIYLATVLALGIAAQWVAWRLRLPSILLLLGLGFAVGLLADPEKVIGRDLLFPLVSLSVAVILFEGGLSLRVSELRETGGVVFSLVTVGVAITWLLTAAAAWILLDFDPSMALLLGAILVVSGPTVIIPLLQHVRPVGRIGSTIKWEGIVNDPIGAVLAVLVFDVILSGRTGSAAGEAILQLLTTAAVGTLVGVGIAFVLILLLKRYWIPDYLHSPFFLAAVVLAFTAANWHQAESGLVAVTVMGVMLANQKEVIVKHVVEFKENLRVLLISTLFIVLASRVQFQELIEIGWPGLAFLAVLLFVVRPVMVLISTLGSELNRRERLFLAWMHPRGIVAAAVSSLFALEIVAGHDSAAIPAGFREQAAQLAPITFLVIIGSVTVYGLTSAPLARWLGLAGKDPQGILFAGAAPWIRAMAAAVQREGYRVMLVDTNYPNIAAARMAGLPTCYASILSEYVHEEQELGEIGRLLAMTPNNEVNALATIEFAEHFSRANVYQLPPPESTSGRRTPVAENRPGRHLFDPGASYARLAARFAEGAEIKTTSLTEDFDFEDFQSRYGETALVLFIVEESGKLTVCTADSPPAPRAGQKLIALVDPVEEKESESA